MEEQAILEGIRKSDPKSYEALINEYSSYIAAIIIKVTSGRLSREEIEELSADVFIKFWQKREVLEIEQGKLKAYLGVMARNQAINELRSKGKADIISLEEDSIDYETPESELLRAEDKKLIAQALKVLPEPDHEIFIRRYFYMEKVVDIAKALGLNTQTVGTKLFRGKKKLEETLKKRGVSYE